jgi:hypothetical protein
MSDILRKSPSIGDDRSDSRIRERLCRSWDGVSEATGDRDTLPRLLGCNPSLGERVGVMNESNK